MSMYEDVCAFHDKFGLPHPGDGGTANFLTPDVLLFRLKFMEEELNELRDAYAANNICDAADALCDLIYVALGTGAIMRLPIDDCWDEVHRANMTKVRATGADDPRSRRAHELDVVKPADFVPPDHGPAIKRAMSPHRMVGDDDKTARWDRRRLALARHVASWSKDPSTKVGCVIIGSDPRHVAHGYNGFPPGIADTPERLNDRATKYMLTQHAERNALDNATFDTRGATLYSTLHPCIECSKSIRSKGIGRVVYTRAFGSHDQAFHRPEEHRAAGAILHEAGVVVVQR